MTSRHGLLRQSLLAAAFIAGLAGTALAETVKVTFVLTNDTYEMDEEDGRGGYPRLTSVIKAERAANPNTLVVHAGDLLSPSLLSGIDQGEHMIVLTNMAGIEVMAPGNHEWDFGTEVATRRQAESKFPWIAANVMGADGKPVAGMDGTMIKEFGGVKIGLIGLAHEKSNELANTGDLKFGPTYDTAKAEAAKLREAGADLVVAINHNDRDVAQRMVDDAVVDLDLNGHNHDLWMFWNGKAAGVESGSDAQWVAAIDVTFDIGEKDGKRTVSWRPNFRFTDTATVEPDAEVAAKVAEYAKLLDEELKVELGTTSVALDSRKASVRGMETMMGNLVADGMRAAVGADLAITNGGGIRGDKEYPAGTKLTRRDILSELPFGNKTVMVELTGAQVKAALENGVSQIEKGGGRFPQVSGLTFTADRAKPAGERVAEVMVDGKPIDEAATYTVATNDFMARGGDGYTMFGEGKLLVTPEMAKLMANDVMAHIRQMGEVKAGEGARITLK